MYNAYHENKYTKLLMTGKKYYQIFFYGALGLGAFGMSNQC